MTDRDIMIHLCNTALALRQIAQERGIKISICASPVTEEPYVTIRAGDYEYVDFGDRGRYEYAPMNRIIEWEYITPEQVNFGGKPKAKTPEAATPGVEGDKE